MAKSAINYTGLIPEVGDSFESATTNTTGSLKGIDIKLGELNINKADLINGKIPIDQIPLSMNDFQEGYYKTLDNLIYKDSGYTILLDKLTDVLYLDLNTKNQYRYTGTIYEYVGTGAEATPSSNGLMSAFDKKKLDKKPYTFNTAAEMQDFTTLVEGDTIQLLGYYTKNDGAGHIRKISASDDGSGIAVGGLWANYIPENGIYQLEHLGIKGDGIFDNTTILNKYCNQFFGSHGGILRVGVGKFRFTSTIRLSKNVILEGVSGNSLIRFLDEKDKTVLYADFDIGNSTSWAIESYNYNSTTDEFLGHNTFPQGEEIFSSGYTQGLSIQIKNICLTSNYSKEIIFGGIRLTFCPMSKLENVQVQGHFGIGILRNACWNFSDTSISTFTHFYGYTTRNDVNSADLLDFTLRKDIDRNLNITDYQKYLLSYDTTNTNYLNTFHLNANYQNYEKALFLTGDTNNINISVGIEGFKNSVMLLSAYSINFLRYYSERPENLVEIAGSYCSANFQSTHIYSKNAKLLDMGFDCRLGIRMDGLTNFNSFSIRSTVIDEDTNVNNRSFLSVYGKYVPTNDVPLSKSFIENRRKKCVYQPNNTTLINESIIYTSTDSGQAITLPLAGKRLGDEILIMTGTVSNCYVHANATDSTYIKASTGGGIANTFLASNKSYRFVSTNIAGTIKFICLDL